MSKIEASRKEGGLSYICCIMGPQLKSEVSVDRGINVLSTDEPQSMVELYHRLVNSAALKGARVSLECVGGELGSSTRSHWQSTGFSKIERLYYGPSVSYHRDIISFIVFDPASDSHFDFVVNLELNPFSEQQIRASKTVRVFFGRDKNVNTSVDIASHQYPFTLHKVELKCSPFESSTLVRLTKMISDVKARKDSEVAQEMNLRDETDRKRRY